ncbi:hypothetical protein CYLTODRAFT_414086 [Cylindrobasidium torrendii FP15055 ss-10]|uniref:F-box domain-containing protein n=1 Tax=Cylindrobasidium torrendii FP15055 ss-10 TaxID=1314674 RepID=A0A0D7AYQ1_9AGAR|nr:hypothetical protein CYLTODRAFT_414086 [Cylindrobasidium torrendii FP15055 ss-10]
MATRTAEFSPRLDQLPYDVFLAITFFLDIPDVYNISLTCKGLRGFINTKPIFRIQAAKLLAHCRPLPLKGFNQISDLSRPELAAAVTRTHRTFTALQTRGPRPLKGVLSRRALSRCSFLDATEPEAAVGVRSWYRTLRLPMENEDYIDWFSTITSKYVLCSTKKGTLYCQNIETSRLDGAWTLGYEWELWKCKVDLERRRSIIIMADKVDYESDNYHTFNPLVNWGIAEIQFPGPGDNSIPEFFEVARFATRGLTMNVFILDQTTRTIAFLCMLNHHNAQHDMLAGTLGLLFIPDWEKPGHVYIDTGIDTNLNSGWTCVLLPAHKRLVLIHHEDAPQLTQYVYPLDLLKPYMSHSTGIPATSALVRPVSIVRREFLIFIFDSTAPKMHVSLVPATSPLNPYPSVEWPAECSYFLRQWWPQLEKSEWTSSGVALLTQQRRDDIAPQQQRNTLVQYYFDVPTTTSTPGEPTVTAGRPLHMWHIHTDFVIACIKDHTADAEEEDNRPLIAVDFGVAVWLEHQGDSLVLSFATFPEVDASTPEGCEVHQLATPPELDLAEVESLTIDQSHMAVIVCLSDGEVYVLCYE